MYGVILNADGSIQVVCHDPKKDDAIIKAVGGWYEPILAFGLPKPVKSGIVCALVNEEGRLLELPANPVASAMCGQKIVGNAYFLKTAGNDFSGLDEDEVLTLVIAAAKLGMELVDWRRDHAD